MSVYIKTVSIKEAIRCLLYKKRCVNIEKDDFESIHAYAYLKKQMDVFIFFSPNGEKHL